MVWIWQKVHISWFIAVVSSGVVAGTALCLLVNPNLFTGFSWLLFAGSLFIIAIVRRPRIFLPLAFIAGLVLGLARGSTVAQEFISYQPYYNQEVMVQGRIVEDVSYGKAGEQRVRIGSVSLGGASFGGEIWSSLTGENDIKRGDRVSLSGTLLEGFGNVQATMFRAEVASVVRPHPGDIGRQFRDWFASGIRQAIPEPQVSLGTGYLLGQKNALPETLQEQIRITGLTHVVVASGYNLMILVIFARRALSRISKYLAALAGGAMIAGFMLITGLSSSMSRAGLVAALGLLAWYYGRKMHPVILLSFAAAITLLVRPAYIWGDIGWFLSFAAFSGILLLAPLLHSYFWGQDRRPSALRELCIATLSAQIMTLPLIVYVFGQYSPYALLANVLVLPVVPFAMLFTFIAGVGALTIPGLATIFGLPAVALLSYSTYVIGKIAAFPGAAGEVQFSSSMLAMSYGMAVAVIIYLSRKTKYNFRGEKPVVQDAKYL